MKAILLTLFVLFTAWPAAAAETPAATPPLTYVQMWVGALDAGDDSWESSDTENGSAEGDLGTLPFGGGAGQRLWGSSAWRYGFEGGGVTTWKSDITDFRGASNEGGGAVRVRVDTTYFSLGMFMGGVVSLNLSRYVRLYAAAGPSVTWAWLENDGNNNDNTTNHVDFDNENDISFAGYGRAGIEFVLDNGFTFGASVRHAEDEFSFGSAGDLKLDEPLYLLTVGALLGD